MSPPKTTSTGHNLLERVSRQVRPKIPKGGKQYTAVHGLPQLWTPFWLRKVSLIGFCVLQIGFLVVLVVLWHISQKQNGISVSPSTNHYVWIYGPTAVLVIVVGFWRQVDYHCKALVPWAEMRHGYVRASQALMLDYVSPFQVIAFWKALRQGHMAVLFTITGFWILKLIIIFSTGLFVLKPTVMFDKALQYKATTRFNATRSQPSALFGLSSSGANAMDPMLVHNYYAMLSQDIVASPGLTRGLTYSDFVVEGDIPPNAMLSAEVDAFVPSLVCEDLEITTRRRSFARQEEIMNDFNGNAQLEVSYKGPICKNSGSTSVPMLNPWNQTCPSRQIVALEKLQQFCDSGESAFFYILAEFIYDQAFDKNGNFANASIDVPIINAIVCSPSYTFEKLRITYNSAERGISNPQVGLLGTPLTESKPSPDFPPGGLSNAFANALLAVGNLFGQYPTSGLVPFEESPDTLFHLMAVSQGHNDLEVLLDAERMKDAATLTFMGIISQYAHKYLKETTYTIVDGQTSYFKDRLHLRPSSLWVMVAGFGVMTCLATGVLLLRPVRATPGDPSSLGALASILASSDKLEAALSATGHAKEKDLCAAFADCRCTTLAILPPDKFSNFPVILISPEGNRPSPNASLKWWHPPSIKLPSISITIACAICAIIALAVLQRVSDSKAGICDVRDDRKDGIFTHYIPALVMLLIATLFSSLDFNVSLFSPFAALLKGNSLARRSVLSHLLGKLPPLAILESILSRHWGALFSSMAALIGSVLTIIVSGLYVIEATHVAGSLQLQRLDDFNLTWDNSALNDSGAAATSVLIEHMNLTYPDWTYGELALPRLDYGDWLSPGGKLQQIAGSMSSKIPTVRANLDCEIVPRSRYTITTSSLHAYVGATDGSVHFVAEADLPEACQAATGLGTQSTFKYESTYAFAKPEPPNYDSATFGGSLQDLHFVEIPSRIGSELYSQPEYRKFIKDNPPGCPSLAFTFGHFRQGVTDPTNVTSMICFQRMQEVMANVTFKKDVLHAIDQKSPPVVDEASVRHLKNGDTGSFDFEYRLQDNLWYALEIYKDGRDLNSNDAYGFQVDSFYKAVTSGVEAIPGTDLVGAENEDRLLNATNHFYRKYMAQAVHANMRQGCSSGCGTLQDDLHTTASVPRLKQNFTSALTLMVMLGCMSVGGCLASFLTRMHQVLPHNPCSIAGAMSLLAGSAMCSREVIPMGAEWMSEKELEKVFGGRRYRMGWWDRGDGLPGIERGRYGIDIDDRQADASESRRDSEEEDGHPSR